MIEAKTSVCIFYPADPMGVVAGGIDTFIRGILRWAPEDLDIRLVGMSTDQGKRPVGRWSTCDLGRTSYQFYPVGRYGNVATRGRIPLVIRYMWGLLRYRPEIDAEVIEFHRIEPSLLFYLSKRRKNAFFHQNMQVLHNANADILWNRLPGLYFWVQDKLIRKLDSVYAVKRDAVAWFQERYSDISGRFRFVPTWYDPEVFSVPGDARRQELRRHLSYAPDEKVLITVGRLDTQKDPLMLAAAFCSVLHVFPKCRLVYVGDGVLRGELESYISDHRLGQSVTLLGLRPASEIAGLLQAADLFVLSSAYEGMPMCVLEALGSGLPVVTTDVGEVGLVVQNDVNGCIVPDRSELAMAEAIIRILPNLEAIRGQGTARQAADYTPEKVLAPVYDNYRALAGRAVSPNTGAMPANDNR